MTNKNTYAKQLNRPKKAAPALPAIPKELLDQFGQGAMTAEAINAASMAFKKALSERALGAEFSHLLGYPPGTAKPEEMANQRNGKSGKTVLTQDSLNTVPTGYLYKDSDGLSQELYDSSGLCRIGSKPLA